MPIEASAEVQTEVSGQPLPPMPRQPSSQVWLPVSQTLPLSGPPQLESTRQPTHWPMLALTEVHCAGAGQPLPFSPRQPSMQLFEPLHTLPLSGPPHCASVAHSQTTPLRPEQLHVAIIGAGATGVELAAELHALSVRSEAQIGHGRLEVHELAKAGERQVSHRCREHELRKIVAVAAAEREEGGGDDEREEREGGRLVHQSIRGRDRSTRIGCTSGAI